VLRKAGLAFDVVERYGQDSEIRLLAKILPRLTSRTVVDVGAQRGRFALAMLGAGAELAHAIEPDPRNLEWLRKQSCSDRRLTVHGLAMSTQDGDIELHLSRDAQGLPISVRPALQDRPRDGDKARRLTVRSQTRSLASLVATGEIPAHIGILHVDTESDDLAVIAGIGELDCDVIVVRHGPRLPAKLGSSPWATKRLVAALSPRGFGHFALFIHWDEFSALQWDESTIPAGRAGSLVFLHNRVVTDLLPYVLETSSSLGRTAAGLAERRSNDAGAEPDFETTEATRRFELDEAWQPTKESDRSTAGRDPGDPRVVFGLLREQTNQLDALAAELAEVRLLLIEQHVWRLRHRRRVARLMPRRLREVLGRIRGLTKPRIGGLRHHVPRPLRVPSSYMRTEPPWPAPTIAVVVPSFQHGRFIERTLQSVIDQGYPALECVVQDGGSTDETLAILPLYENELAGWASARDSGQAEAINRAFARTSGELMAWLNSDDLLLPGSLAYVACYFAAHPDVDVVYGNRLMIDENDDQIGAWILPKHDDLILTLADYVPQETLFWRRSIWEASGGHVDPSFNYALDWDLLLRFRSAGATMVRVPRFLGAFRVHDEQKTSVLFEDGIAEMARLRYRATGRHISVAEVNTQLRRYFRRHVLLHTRQRLIDRLPLSRVTLGAPVPRTFQRTAEPADRSTSPTTEGARASIGRQPSR